MGGVRFSHTPVQPPQKPKPHALNKFAIQHVGPTVCDSDTPTDSTNPERTEMTELRGVPSLYIVPCPACSEVMEAHTAAWCHCVGKQVSPCCCPQCGQCLCRA